MTDVITKVAIGWVEYPFAGWSSEVSAEDVSYDNSSSWAVANNIQDAMDEVFQSVSNGKELIADAITDKGVSTSATDSFQTMATNIGLIETANQTIENIITQNPTLKNGIRIHRTTINSNASNPPVKRSDSEFYTIDHNVYIVWVLSWYNDSQVTWKIICIWTDWIIQNVDTWRCTWYAISFWQVEWESDLIYIYSYSNNYNYAICTYNLSTKQLTQISSPYQITSTITPYTEPKTVNINLVTDYNQYDYEKIYDYLIN